MSINTNKQEFLIQELDNVEKTYGEITPKNTVDYARPDSSPLHEYFEWNDTIAAEKHRHQQARILIKRVYYNFSPDEKEADNKIRVRYYMSLQNEQEDEENPNRRYINVYNAMSNEKLRQQTLQNAKRELEMFSNKYRNLTELASVIKEISRVIDDSN
jgi:hypothetical protein